MLCGDATRASRRLIGQSDLLERSASLPLKPRAMLNDARRRDKLPTQLSSNCVWSLSLGLVGLGRAADIQGEVAMVRPFRVFLRKGVDFLVFELFGVVLT